MATKPKLVLLTGGNSGIGLGACKILCKKGYTVVATVRSEEKGETMTLQVKEACPEADINYMICEMSDPSSIRDMVKQFQTKWLTEGRKLDILINNAGAMYNQPEKKVSEVNPDWEKTIVVNALGPVTLTDLLLDCLKETAAEKGEARILMVNSSVTSNYEWMSKEKVDMDDIMYTKPGSYKGPWQTYKLSKMIQMMASLALSEELCDTNVKINSVCTGPVVGTNIFTANATEPPKLMDRFVLFCLRVMTGKKNADEGGQYVVDIADTELGSARGTFYLRGKVISPNPQVADKTNQMTMLQVLRDMAKSV